MDIDANKATKFENVNNRTDKSVKDLNGGTTKLLDSTTKETGKSASTVVGANLSTPEGQQIIDLHSLTPSTPSDSNKALSENNEEGGKVPSDPNNPINLLTPEDSKNDNDNTNFEYPSWHPASFENNAKL